MEGAGGKALPPARLSLANANVPAVGLFRAPVVSLFVVVLEGLADVQSVSADPPQGRPIGFAGVHYDGAPSVLLGDRADR
jgi:hypothetical protein